MITVHHLENSRSQRVLWLLEELELPYEIVRYERDRKTMLAPPGRKRVQPLAQAPPPPRPGAGDPGPHAHRGRDRAIPRKSAREAGPPPRRARAPRGCAAL